MKKAIKTLPLILFACAGLFAFTTREASGIKGTVTPADGAAAVWAINGTDSAKVEAVQGAFQFSDIKAGTYKIVVQANAPYKNFEKDNVAVNDGEVTDLGSITLEQ